MKTIFAGTPEICLPTLQALHQHPLVDLHWIVSMPDRKAGRGLKIKKTAVAQFAIDYQVNLLQTACLNREDDFWAKQKKEGIDLIVIFAFSQFVSQKIIDFPKKGCYNIHTSLLPKYRGAAPIQHALLNGERETGVSIQKIALKMDAGGIALTHKVPIEKEDNGQTLHDKLMAEAAMMIPSFIHQIAQDKLTTTPQDESQVSFAPSLSKQDGKLDFANKSFDEIHNRIRAMTPWPGSFCYLNDKYLKVFDIAPIAEMSLAPGTCENKKGALFVGMVDQTIRIKKLQLEGKKACSDTELLNGIRTKIKIT